MVIVSYDSLQREPDELLELNPQVVVLDEAHYIKNGKVCYRALVGMLESCTNAPNFCPHRHTRPRSVRACVTVLHELLLAHPAPPGQAHAGRPAAHPARPTGGAADGHARAVQAAGAGAAAAGPAAQRADQGARVCGALLPGGS